MELRWENSRKPNVKFIFKKILMNGYGYEVNDFENKKQLFLIFVYKRWCKTIKEIIKKAIQDDKDSFNYILSVLDKRII